MRPLQDVSAGWFQGVEQGCEHLYVEMGLGAGLASQLEVLSDVVYRCCCLGSDIYLSFPPRRNTDVEQSDIHMPRTTVREALQISGLLRLHGTTRDIVEQFVDEVMGLVELESLRDSIVGSPGQFGLSVEQRKRLTIAVELVANPSIVFMDE